MPITSHNLFFVDADGPLIYSIETVWGATNMVLEYFGLQSMDLETWRKKLRPPYEKLYIGEGVPQRDVGKALELFQKFARELKHTTRRVEVEDTLKRLGYGRVAVVTDMSQESWDRYAEDYGFDKYISVAITRDSCEDRKPSPNPIFVAMERLGVSKKRINAHKRSPCIRGLMVGDTVSDVIAGRNAGMDTAALYNDGSYNNCEKLMASGPTYLVPSIDVITNPRELHQYQKNRSLFERKHRR